MIGSLCPKRHLLCWSAGSSFTARHMMAPMMTGDRTCWLEPTAEEVGRGGPAVFRKVA